jgi:hypothetical protein
MGFATVHAATRLKRADPASRTLPGCRSQGATLVPDGERLLPERFDKDVDYKQKWKGRKCRFQVAQIKLPSAERDNREGKQNREYCYRFVHCGIVTNWIGACPDI